ncbi:MAG: biopolymer transporter ExbD [Pikeienuella sp.]|uniref:biopolymer transporter ExbD n=1 Tax=Pikeienuella sp. TaxID=2831957 RepID=UPI00391AC9EC
MRIEPAPPRRAGEPILPMINVVFLLLVFFVMTAEIAPPEPFEVSPPRSAAAEGGAALALHLSPEGEFGFGDLRGDEAAAAAIEEAAGGPLRLRADGGMEAARVAAALARLAAMGAGAVELAAAQGSRP